VNQIRRCELLTLDAHLSSWQRCGRRGSPTVPDGLAYRTVCAQHRAEVARVRAAGLAKRLRWAEEVRP
jgi:hypothetical protein